MRHELGDLVPSYLISGTANKDIYISSSHLCVAVKNAA